MNKKKAFVEVQFNWVFILVVGIIILLFFVGVSQWYRTSKEKEIAHDVLFKLETILTGAQVSSRTASQIDMPRVELVFSCDPDECTSYGCTSSFEFEDTGVDKDTAMDIIFSQRDIKTDLVNAWALDWVVAYKVTNFLYLSTPDVKYYLVYNDSTEEFAQDVFSKLGENTYINIKLINGADVVAQAYNNEHLVKFVMFYVPLNLNVHQTMKDSGRWDVIFVAGDEDYGEITFSKISGNLRVPDDTKVYPYIGVPSLIGAIYAQDFENYKCNMKKALLRLRVVNEIYMHRTEELYTYFAGDMQCEFYYDTNTVDQFKDIRSALADLDDPQTSSIFNAVQEIKDYNVQANIRSCPRIY